MTILKIKKRTNPYLQIDKTPIEDENLSWRARGMLAYLIGRPSNWEISVNQLTKASDSDGRRAVQSTLKELEEAEYLVRYPYRNPETGLMDGWRSMVFETPSDCQEWKAENIDSKAHSPTDTFCARREDARRESRPTETVRQINIEAQQRKNLITFPQTPFHSENPEEEREEGENLNQEENTSSNQTSSKPIDLEDYWESESHDLNSQPINPEQTETSVNQEDESNISLSSQTCLGGEKDGGGVVCSQALVKHTTKTYDSALGIKPPSEQKNLQQRAFNWVPEGVWNINGKLDPNFVDWLAKDWQKSFGGDFHRKRADVLRHFKKDPANIAIAWTQYESETRHRYENAAVRMHNGMEIKAEEQQQLLSRSRAVSERMDEQVNPVAVDVTNSAYLTQIEGRNEQKVIDCHHEDKPALMANNVGVTSTDNSYFQKGEETESKGINPVSPSQPPERIEQVTYSAPPQDLPRDEKGCAENPDAYRLWQPEKLEGEQVNLTQLRERLASLSQRFAMPKPKKEVVKPKNQIEELNEWLKEPILRKEVMARVMKSEDLTVEFDEEGVPIRVIRN